MALGAGPKVFGVGLSKTGTSSLRTALEILGYRVSGPNKRLLRRLRRGDIGSLIEHTRHFDAFEDFPYPLAYRELHRHYGEGARFILTRRRSPEVWYASICDHARTSRLLSGQWLTYGHYRPFGRERDYRAYYERHNEDVRAYFRDHGAPGQLLELCWEEGDGWPELCAFLDKPIPAPPFPHANRSDRARFKARRLANRVIEAMATRRT